MESNQEFIYIIFIFLICIASFSGLWLTILFLTSYFGTWSKLYNRYNFPKTLSQPLLIKKFQSAQIGISNYNAVLTLTFYKEGISFEPIFLFKFAHPKFLIPWKDIKLNKRSQSIFSWNKLDIGNPPFAKINVSDNLLETILAYSEKEETDDRW
ncbi:MAG TPA: hypothetical protein PK079_04545 [Leptospiraceae bacterium]|nr:hypothetical protein [Leptospiraceae bacterium]HMW04926.1 hypothetical protein [Leptospiraceae bacterium]HMX31925.1 hypothetical protein [Leptospiraceae bacterium]HMY30853.1 hypothetical protein [Leptospiraceae bacterium]HMZ62657.1 hypothetical protein [Leptospiraceae bacterium]